MESAIVEDVVIVGAGVAGLATAVALRRVGVRALVLEKAEELRTTGAALTLFPNGWKAIVALGLSHKFAPFYDPITRSVLTDMATGVVHESPVIFPDGVGPRAVHRKVLSKTLAEELPVDSIRFSSRLAAIETREERGASIVIVHLEDGTIIKTKILIGCDGLHSIVARWLGLPAPIHSGRMAARGLANFPGGHGVRQEIRQFLHMDKRAGFGPLDNHDVYLYMLCRSSATEKNTRDPKLIQRELLDNYAKGFPSEYLEVVERADLSTLTWTPLTLRHPWSILIGKLSKGNITVVGDAMHPMTPDLGQGGCAALEDAVILTRYIANSMIRNNGRIVDCDIEKAIKEYVSERRWRVAALTTVSFLSGWVQQDGSKWSMRLLRHLLFKHLLSTIGGLLEYDCGKLPAISLNDWDHSNWKNT